MPSRPIDVFLSYSREDDAMRRELVTHLAGLQRQNVIRAWHDGMVSAGENRAHAQEEQIRGASVILLLVSADFIASDYCYTAEMQRAFERAAAGEIWILPVLVRDCDWDGAPFAHFEPLPRGGVPVTRWPNRDEAWKDVVLGVRAVLERLHGAANKPPVSPITHSRIEALAGAPELQPRHADPESQALREQLISARKRRSDLEERGLDTAEIDREILDLRRKLREAGQLKAGDVLGGGRYQLIERAGRGGFAVVWKAHDRERGELVAIKVLHGAYARDPIRRERFARGARKMASLDHKGIVRVLALASEERGHLYFVMELMAGGSLQRAVLERRLTGDRILSMIVQIGEALTHAHGKGLVHRDVKPSNILLDAESYPKLSDFDLVSAADTTGGTRTAMLGTWLYSAPELMERPQDADAAADVFGLGMTALFGLSGAELPSSAFRDGRAFIEKLPCSKALKRVLTRAVAWEKSARYRDTADFCEALREVLKSADGALLPEALRPSGEVIGSASAPHPNSSGRPLIPPTYDHAVREGEAIEAAAPPSESANSSPPASLIGQTIDGRYEIVNLLGEGGMGIVFLARHKILNKPMALKILRPDRARSRSAVDRFIQEARAVSEIGSPHLVDVSDFGALPDGSSYFVMEYLNGRTLSNLLQSEGRLPVKRACVIALQIASGVGAVHASGIVHRDLKPDNVFLIKRSGDPDFVKILDFGIAKMARGDAKITVSGAVMGTPHYMSPEQILGASADQRADIYSLGIMLYEMVSGHPPFEAEDPKVVWAQHMFMPAPPLKESAPDCGPGIEAVVHKCLSKKPEARYPSMAELADDLRRVITGVPPRAAASSQSRRRWLIYGAPAVALASLSAALFGQQAGFKPAEPAVSEPGAALDSLQPPAPSAANPQVRAETPNEASVERPKRISVGLAATPESAVGIHEGKLLKLPTTLEVAEGSPAVVVIQAEGYEPMTVTLDGTEQIKMVKLVKIPPANSTRQGVNSTRQAPGLVNPFDPQFRDRPR